LILHGFRNDFFSEHLSKCLEIKEKHKKIINPNSNPNHFLDCQEEIRTLEHSEQKSRELMDYNVSSHSVSVNTRQNLEDTSCSCNLNENHAQDYHPYVSVFMKLMSERLNNEYYINFAQNKSMELFTSLDPDIQNAACQLGGALHNLLKKVDVRQSSTHQKLAHPQFTQILAQLLTTSLVESTKDIITHAERSTLPIPIERNDKPTFCRPQDYYFLDSCEMSSQIIHPVYDRLKELKPFVLDNSLRESTVAQQRGHVKSDKYAILKAVESTGLEQFIVAAFGELPRVEDQWMEELQRNGEMKPNFWAFTELRDAVVNGIPSPEIPLGLKKIIQYQIPNVIIEIDLSCTQTDWNEGQRWNLTAHCELIRSRLITIKEKLFQEKSQIFINFRDAVKTFQNLETAHRLVVITVYLAKLPKSLRPLGLLFEEPDGTTFPWQIRDLVVLLRKTMENNGWADGELLIHVHKNYGLSEAVIQEALAWGCTGIWCGVSEEGAGTGVGSTLMTLTNLARLGNQQVTQMFHFPRLYEAAREITLRTTGEEPHPKTEIYGERARDILWNQKDKSQFDVASFFDLPSSIRITTFTTAQMFRQQLANTFGHSPEDWELTVAENMRKQLHEDLLNNQKLDYQSPTALYDLYLRSGGKKYLQEMIETIVAQGRKKGDGSEFDRKNGVPDEDNLS
jgi:hypothetical protein